MDDANESMVWKAVATFEEYMPSFQTLIYLAIAVLLSNIALLVLSKSQREILYASVKSCTPAGARGRRNSSANTPPRSLTPDTKVMTDEKVPIDEKVSTEDKVPAEKKVSIEKKVPIEKKASNNGQPPVEYKNIFPPSSRDLLLKVAESLSASKRRNIGVREIDQEEFTKNVIPLEADYRTCGPSTYTPTGISMAEIKALGDFPDYSKLSGVPLPEAYKEFEIEKALPRPYRPFRWAYHQTMCKSNLYQIDW